MEEVETNCGIYFIINRCTGRFYVGSSTDFCGRFKEHKRRIRRRVHSSKFINLDAEKYGDESFIFMKIQCCDWESEPLYLKMVEQFYIDYYNPTYNENKDALSAFRSTEDRYIIKIPNGDLVKAKSLDEFCLNYGLDRGSLYKTVTGRYIHCKKYQARKIGDLRPFYELKEKGINSRKRYCLVYPDGRKVEVCNASEFCEQNDICLTSFCRAAKQKYMFKTGKFANYLVFPLRQDQTLDSITDKDIEFNKTNHKNKKNVVSTNKIKVFVYTYNFEFLGEFESINSVTRQLGIHKSTVKYFMDSGKLYKRKDLIFRSSPIEQSINLDCTDHPHGVAENIYESHPSISNFQE